MGYSYESEIERAGRFLTALLEKEGAVPYSRFYDGSDETHDALIRGMGFDTSSDETSVPDCPEHLIDLAAGQLETQGVVTVTLLDDSLADGEPNYRIDLTAAGREMLARHAPIRYWTAE